MCQIRSSLLSLLGCERGWIASPGASRSAERRDTSAMVFEDSLQKSHVRHVCRASNAAWRCKTKHWKEIPVCCNTKPKMKPKMIKMCLLQLCSFFIGDFGLQNEFFEINSATMDLTRPTSHLLTCLGHEHAQKATGPVFWISLPSPCGVPWFPVKTRVKQEINPWLHVPNQNMPKYRIDANTPDPPCTSSRALKRETSEVDFRCS